MMSSPLILCVILLFGFALEGNGECKDDIHDCQCFDDDDYGQPTVSCRGKGLKMFPNDLPNVPSMHLEDNNILQLKHIAYPALRHLILDRNNIHIIQDGAFSNMTNLTSLTLAYNSITTVTSGTFKGLSSVTLLSLEGNPLGRLVAGTFTNANLPSLQVLKLPHCQIHEVQKNAFDQLNSLWSLNISYNLLIAPVDFLAAGIMPRLESLDLSSNMLFSLRRDVFRDVKDLAHLHLSDNRLKKIQKGTFDGLIHLKNLYLRNNEISAIDEGTLSSLRMLRDLDLSGNQMTRLDRDCLPWIRMYRLLLYNNPWRCDCQISWMQSSQQLKTWNRSGPIVCASPPRLAGKELLTLGADAMATCQNPTHIAVGVLASVFIVVVVSGLLIWYVGKKKSTRRTPATISSTIPPYSRLTRDVDFVTTA